MVEMLDSQVEDGERVYSLGYGMDVDARIVVERGRIALLVWRWLLRSVGKAGRTGIFAPAADGL